jgi:ribosomal protein S18 acetylase RimI-like enzyme
MEGRCVTFRLRRYRRSDLDAVKSLHRIGLAQVGLAPGDGVYYDDDFPRIHQVYLADRGEFLVGEISGAGTGARLVAMGGLRRIDDETAEICRMRTHPEFQRRGYGTRMLRALEARAVELGYGRLRLDTTLNQTAAWALYLRHGWREVARETVGDLTVLYGEKSLLHLCRAGRDHCVIGAGA